MGAQLHRSVVLKLVFVVLVLVLVLELGSKGVLYYMLGVRDGDYAHYYENDPQLRMITWTEGYSAHPYFGYESSTMRASEDLLSQRTANDFVVGILGGSVAGSFAEYCIRNPSLFDSLTNVIPALREKTLRIVNLANGGYKQPQQFFVATYFMDKLDLLINLDGFNDATPGHLLPVYPLDFPTLSAQFYGRASQGGIWPMLGRSARWLYRKMNDAPLSWKFPGLSRSSLYFLSWYYAHDLLYRVVKVSESAYYAKEFGSHQSEALRNTPPKQITEDLIAIWKKYTTLEDDLVRKRTGKLVFFFLQPNQYLKGSKPFSDEEKKLAIDPLRVEATNETMGLLKAAAQELRKRGVPMHDLTGIFSSTVEPVYRDNCCHLNDLGNQIMTGAVVSSILARLSAGSPPAPNQF
jgi:hypothetical protein